MDKHEVVITGLGIVSPYGTDVERFYDRLAACEIALKPSPLAPDSGLWVSECDDFRAEDWMSEKVIDGTDRFSQFALAGCKQALAQAGIGPGDLDPLRTAIVIGTSMGGTRAVERGQHLLETGGVEAVPRKLQILIWPNMAAAQIAMEYQLHGTCLTVTTACAGGIDAVGQAVRTIQAGLADVAITGATEGTGKVEFQSALGANSLAYGMTTPNTDPRKACRPFDRDRTGIAGCEGAGMFILESREHAEARGADDPRRRARVRPVRRRLPPVLAEPDGGVGGTRHAQRPARGRRHTRGRLRCLRPRHRDAEGRPGRDPRPQRRLRRAHRDVAGHVAQGSHGAPRQLGVGDEPRRRHRRDAPRRDPADGVDRQPRPRGPLRPRAGAAEARST